MFVFTQDGDIVNLDNFAVVTYANNDVIGIASNINHVKLCSCDSEREAKLKIQELFASIDHGRKVFYFGELDLPF